MRIIIVGYGELAGSVTLGAIEAGHDVVAFYRWERVKAIPLFLKLKDYFNPSYEYNFIKSLKLNEIEAPSVNSNAFRNQALRLNPDLILVASWGEVIQKKTFDIPKVASVNCHPSMLPEHRGPNPYYSAIRHGEIKTGVSFHLIDQNLDTGPVLIQKEVNISPDDTGETLRSKCAYTARELVKELLEGIVCANLLPKFQDPNKASYYPRATQEDTLIDWKMSAQEIHNQIRASYPWIPCFTRHNNEFLKITKSQIVELGKLATKPGTIVYKDNSGIAVATVDKKAVYLSDIKLYGKTKSFLSGWYLKNVVQIGDILLNFDF